jgi:steroid delta-isomerase-like uncharacterized protein
MTTIDDNKAIVRRFIEEIFVQGRPGTVDELLADDFVAHTWPSTGKPKDDLKAAIGMTRNALADIRFSIDDLIAEGDRVAARLTASARQVGPFMGLAASNKRYEIGEIHVFRLAGGKVVEHWHQFDQMGMMKQLGAMPGAADTAAGTTADADDARQPVGAGPRSSTS